MVSPASTLSFSDGVNQHCFLLASVDQGQFSPNEPLALVLLPSYKNSVCKWDAALNVLPAKDRAMHLHAFCFYLVKDFSILKKNLYTEASVL